MLERTAVKLFFTEAVVRQNFYIVMELVCQADDRYGFLDFQFFAL